MAGIEELADSDNFFYSGQVDVYQEINHNLFMILLENSRGLFYNRQYTCNTPIYENKPNTLNLFVGLRYDIAMGLAIYNQRVSDGTAQGEDLRIAVSQNTVLIKQNKTEVDVTVQYIAYRDTTKIKQINFNIGVSLNV